MTFVYMQPNYLQEGSRFHEEIEMWVFMFHNISKNILVTKKKDGERLKLVSKTIGNNNVKQLHGWKI